MTRRVYSYSSIDYTTWLNAGYIHSELNIPRSYHCAAVNNLSSLLKRSHHCLTFPSFPLYPPAHTWLSLFQLSLCIHSPFHHTLGGTVYCYHYLFLKHFLPVFCLSNCLCLFPTLSIRFLLHVRHSLSLCLSLALSVSLYNACACLSLSVCLIYLFSPLLTVFIIMY